MSYMRTALLMALMTVLLILLGRFIGGTSGALIAFAIAALLNFVSYWFSDRIVLRIYRARKVEGEALDRLVADLAGKAGLPKPALYRIENPQPNAFATGRNPAHAAIAVTSGLLERLDRRELSGVIAHELAHIRNRDSLTMTVTATLAGAVEFLARWAGRIGTYRFGDRREGAPLAMLMMAIFAPLAALLIQLAISRSREFAADATGAEIVGDPLALADALGKLDSAVQTIANPTAEIYPDTAHLFIVNPLSGADFTALFRTHPPIAERILRLKAMADGGASGPDRGRAPQKRRSFLPQAGGTVDRGSRS